MEEFGERIKAIRKSLGLTQQEFANRLKIQRSTIAQYETGRNEPLSATVSLICREYNVDEVWLRTGVGEMFRPRMRDEDIAAFLGGILGGKCTDFQRRLVSVLARMDAADWEILERKLDEIYAETKSPDSIAQEAEALKKQKPPDR